MTAENRRNEHMKGAYAKYWSSAREKVYGFMPYDQFLIDTIKGMCDEQLDKVCEVGIGTGWPIAATLAQSGLSVSGVDIASTLVEKCNENWANIQAEVADAADLHYLDDSFDLTYCVHSSWFLPRLKKSISEMFRVTRSKGYILIDIMNTNNPIIQKVYRQHVFENTNVFGKIYKTIKNTLKLILQSGTQDWPLLVSYEPSNPNTIIEHLSEFGGSNFELYAWEDNNSEKLTVSDRDGYHDYGRIIICCRV